MYFTRGKDLREQYAMNHAAMERLLELLIKRRRIDDFFQHFGIRRIAIAPHNILGEAMAELLRESEIHVVCFLDQRQSGALSPSIPVCPYESIKDKALDAVLLTDNGQRNEIIDILLKNGVRLEDIIGMNAVIFGAERGCTL